MSTATALTNYLWQNTFADGVSGQLHFLPNNSFALSAGPGSNSMGGGYSITSDEKGFEFGMMRKTMMMPSPEAALRENVFGKTFKHGEIIPFDLFNKNSEVPTLRIGEIFFTGLLQPNVKYGVEPTRSFYDVFPTKEFNSGFKWRKVTYDENFVKSTTSEWTEYPRGKIEKYEPDSSVENRVRVNEFIVNGETKAIIHDMTVSTAMVGQ